VALAGAADDIYGGISPILRAGAQLMAAGVVVIEAEGLGKLPFPPPVDLSLGGLGIPVALVWIVGVTNLYNFLDGIDGLAATQTVVAGGAAALLFPGTTIASAGWSLAGAAAGFILLNWHPARIFLGDTGSATLGFLFAALPFEVASQDRGRAVFLVAICLWFFLADGAFTLLRRVVSGQNVWKPHQMHIYQRLVKAGLSHDRVVVIVQGLAAAVAALAVIAGSLDAVGFDWAVLLISVVLFGGYLASTHRLESRASRFRFSRR
jgi:UDP-N-acetylmuramyl pentapeptide phosphotransferase/UDP-N-acetylglucosamine-1-phosphate transferase